jgi:nitrous oxidase accessory protein
MKWLLSIVLMAGALFVRAKTIQVSPEGGAVAFKNAIDRASAGDTVLVVGGVYHVNSMIISKPLIILGKQKPVLDGSGLYEIMTISGNDIEVSGFVFRNSGYSSVTDIAAITIVNAANVRIRNNEFVHTFFGIHVANSHSFVISGNTMKGVAKTEQLTGNGIHLWKCSNALIENNNVSAHRDGIYFEFVTGSRVINNISHHNIRYGLHFMFSNDDLYTQNQFKENGAGVAVMFSKKVTMTKNTFSENWGAAAYGLLLKEISDSRISNNRFYKNTVGILMEGANRIDVSRNEFLENGWAAKVQASCSDNRLFENNFVSNTFDVATNGSLVLNDFSGNYWDKYEGYDRNRDGVGDVPYHPVSLYSMLIEQNANSLMLLRSFVVTLLDKAEKAIPSLTPANLNDTRPHMKKLKL